MVNCIVAVRHEAETVIAVAARWMKSNRAAAAAAAAADAGEQRLISDGRGGE